MLGGICPSPLMSCMYCTFDVLYISKASLWYCLSGIPYGNKNLPCTNFYILNSLLIVSTSNELQPHLCNLLAHSMANINSFYISAYRLLLLLRSAFPIRPRWISISGCYYLLYPPSSLQPQPRPLSPHPYTSFLAFSVSSFMATPSSASFSQYTHHISSVHVHTTSVSPLVFSLQPAPPVLSL